MANYFDQFDSAKSSNFFDQFDPKKDEKPKERTWGEFAADTGVGLIKGAVSVAKLVPMAVGLADTVISNAFGQEAASGGALANPATRALNQAEDYLESKKSSAIRGKEEASSKEAAAFGQKFADYGVIGDVPVGRIAAEFVYKFGNALTDPSLLAQGVSENIASILPAAKAGRMIQEGAEVAIPVVAKQMAAEAVEKTAARIGTAGAITTGAIQQGADIAGDTYEKVLKLPDTTWQLNERYNELLPDVGADKAKQQIAGELATEAGVKAGLASLAINGVGAKFGGATLEQMFLKKPTSGAAEAATKFGTVKGLAKGGFGEAVTEAPEEGYGAYATNLGVSQINPSQDLYEGVGTAAGQGAAVGFGLGGATGAFKGFVEGAASRQRAGTPPPAPPAPNLPQLEQQLGADVTALEQAIDPYVSIGQAPSIDAAIANLGAATNVDLTPPDVMTLAQKRAAVDRNAELIGQANAAGTEFERNNALAQAETALPAAKPRVAEQYVDLAPMEPLQARQRLTVLQDQLGEPLTLQIVPHPQQADKLAIARVPMPLQAADLELPNLTPAVSPAAAQNRIEASALAGNEQQRRAEDAPRQDMISRTMQAIEARGGVASPYEAELLRAANMGQPYTRIDPSLGRPASADEKLTAATGIAVGQEAGQGFGARESTRQPVPGKAEADAAQQEADRLAAIERANARGMAEVETGAKSRQAEAERATQAQIEAANQRPPAPRVNDVIQALVVPGRERTAEQQLTIRQAEQRMDPVDFSIAQRAATAPFQLSQEERLRLRQMREAPAPAPAAPAATDTQAQDTGENAPADTLIGSRVASRLGQSSGGRIVTATGAKFSTQRVAPGATVTVSDGVDEQGNEVTHQVRVVDTSALGNTGKLLTQVGRIFGKKLVVFESDTLKSDGFVKDDDNSSIYVNSKSTLSPLAVFGHEMTHLLKRENADAYNALESVVQRVVTPEGQKSFEQEYGQGANLEELTSDLVGNRFQDGQFWTDVFNEVAAQNPEKAQSIITRMAGALTKAVNSFLKVVRQPGFQADQYVSDLEAVKGAVKTAFTSYAQSQRMSAMQAEGMLAQAEGKVDLAAASKPFAYSPELQGNKREMGVPLVGTDQRALSDVEPAPFAKLELTVDTPRQPLAFPVEPTADERRVAAGRLPVGTGREPFGLTGTETAAPTTRQYTVEQLAGETRRFASGLSAVGDLRPGSDATANEALRGVGAVAGNLSGNAVEQLASAVVRLKTPAFIDSGAFGAFTKGNPVDFDKILAKYDELTAKIGEVAQEDGEVTDYPRPLIVMPDVVGDQAASINLIDKYKGWIKGELTGNISRPIIPIQKGEISMADAYRRVVDILGTDKFIVGIPSNAEAVTPAELEQFLRDAKPKAIHILGAASDSRLQPRLQSVINAGRAGQMYVTADASPIRSQILRDTAAGKDRKQAIYDRLANPDAADLTGRPLTEGEQRAKTLMADKLSRQRETLRAQADAIAAMDENTRDNLEVGQVEGGADAYNLYEARKLAKKPSDKLKRVTDSNSFSLWSDYEYVANVDGELIGVNKEEDPDESDDDTKFVYAYQRLEDPQGSRVVTTTDQVDELFKDVRERKGSAQFSRQRADFTNPEDRTEVSTTRPVPAPKKGRTGTSYDEKWVIDGEDVRASQKHIDAIAKALRSYNTLSGKGNAAKLMQELHDVVVENLLWLHDLVPENVRERAKLWYDGANRIATDWTAKYGVSLRQASGVLAVLSPQMDWFKNVSLGERVISVWKNRQNEAWSPAMTAWLESWVNASKDVDTKASRQAILDEARPLQGKTLAEMNDRQAALYIRAFDEAYHERQYRLVTPEGGFGEYVTNSDDGDASVTWGGFDTIEKAVSILNDGSFRNIDERLGDEHKVRNFYNNIINPGSADGHVTIDTHAVAAALVKGLSGSSKEVADNFGAAGQNAETGASGTYGLFADAYRDAARKRGILPREMQSITWEAVRALFPASIKDQLAPKVDAVWNRFRKGEITRDQAREEVRTLSGGIRKMAWEGSDAGKFAANDGASFNTEIDDDPAKRPARTLPPEVAKDKLRVSLSASTSSIPGIASLQEAAGRGDMLAHRLLQDIALDNLRHLLSGTSARVKADAVTGLYGGSVESSVGATVTFADEDRTQVLAALAKFAENFNQEQVHVRRGTKDKAGTSYDDGSYATPVYRWELAKPLSRQKVQQIVDQSGLYGLTFGDDFIEAYYVGDFNEQEFNAFERGIDAASSLVGKAAASAGREIARLWPYGRGEGAIGYDRIQGDVPAGEGLSSQTAARVAGYLNQTKGKDGKPALGKVKTFEQAEITPEQQTLQERIAQVYSRLPENDLKNPSVRKAYNELSKELLRQYRALPIKVEMFTGEGEPYANSAAMRRDVLDNNHLFIYATEPGKFGPEGQDFSAHPLLGQTGQTDSKGRPMLYNDLLRAVHDYFAHSMSPVSFGPKGEEAAWKNHMAMTNNMWARWALTMETRAQNSWVNFREGLDPSLPLSQRQFAPQKAALLPIEYALTGNRAVDKPMKEFMAKLGDRVKLGSKPVKAAPQITSSRQRTPLGFYSALADSLDNIKTNAAPAAGWKDAIKGLVNKGAVKADEVEWSGINDWLDLQQGRVTKEQVADYLKQGGVRVEETVLGAPTQKSRDQLAQDQYGENYADLSANVRRGIDELLASDLGPKYDEYTLPGGENYREVLLTLPEKKVATLPDGYAVKSYPDEPMARAKAGYRVIDKTGVSVGYNSKRLDGRFDTADEAVKGALESLSKGAVFAESRGSYRSSHWAQPNVIAHIRLNDRTDADGKRVLFVEELQSDWGQAGKKKGFNQPNAKEELRAAEAAVEEARSAFEELAVEGRQATAKRRELREKYDRMLDESERHPVESRRAEAREALVELERLRDIEVQRSREFSDRNLAAKQRYDAAVEAARAAKSRAQGGLPLAPFVTKTEGWLNLALKRVMVMAAEGGYDKVAFVNGEQSADRYDLSKHIGKIAYDEKFRELTTYRMDGSVLDERVIPLDQVDDVVGKEVAQKLADTEPVNGKRTLEGLDLKVGGEGMKTFYDTIVPTALKKLLPKVGGGGVASVTVNTAQDLSGTPDDLLVKINPTSDGRFRVGVGAGEARRAETFPTREQAQAWADEQVAAARSGRLSSQPSFDVTDAMREKVAGGLPLFSRQRIVGENARTYTPEQLAMFKNVGRTVEVPTIKERLKELRQDLGKKMAQGIADQFRPIKDLSKDAYMLARLSKGAAGAFEALLHHGKLSITADKVYDGDQSGGFIERVGVPLQGELHDFLWWVAANRADRLSQEDRENLFTAEDIAAGRSLDAGTTEFDYTLQHGPRAGTATRDRTLIYRDAAKTFDEFNKNTLDMAEESGLIDAESRKYWEHEFYVPFYRVADADNGGVMGARVKSGLVRQEAFKRLKGGEQKLNSDLLANTLSNWGHLIDAAAKNRAGLETLKAAVDAEIAVEADEQTVRQMGKSIGKRGNVVSVMDQGKERFFLVDDPMLLTAITSLDYAGMRSPVMDAMSTMKHWLTVGVTASPAFKIRNLVRDSVQAVATAPLSYNIGKNLAEGLKASDRKGQTYVSALASGGLIRFGTMLEGSESKRVQQLIKMGVKDSTILDSESKVQQMYDRYIEPAIMAYNELGNRGEEINRAALFKQLQDQGMSQGEAALMARDLMDFSMQGSWATIRFLTQVVPFMNARLQGLYKLGRASQEDKARFGIVLGSVALASIALMLAYRDDDDWKKREDWDRNNNWWFKIAGVAFRIPKPFEIGTIATVAERGLEFFIDKEMTGKRLWQNYKSMLLDSLSMNPTPQLVKPLVDLYANKDSFTGRPIETMGMDRLQPQYRYTQGTSMVARGLSTATGGVLSPVQYDHVIRGYFSWLGSMALTVSDAALRPLTGQASRPAPDYWKAATGGIVAETGSASSRYVSQMYDQAKEIEEAMGTYRMLMKTGRAAEGREFYAANKEQINRYGAVEKVKAAETRYNELIRMIERSAMDPELKKERIRQYQEQKDKIARIVAPGYAR